MSLSYCHTFNKHPVDPSTALSKHNHFDDILINFTLDHHTALHNTTLASRTGPPELHADFGHDNMRNIPQLFVNSILLHYILRASEASTIRASEASTHIPEVLVR